jgi:hypothetical protein
MGYHKSEEKNNNPPLMRYHKSEEKNNNPPLMGYHKSEDTISTLYRASSTHVLPFSFAIFSN